MRRSPDGKRDVIEMKVPIEGRRGRVVIISGLGLPTKVGIGATDLPDEDWLAIENRGVRGGGPRYDTIETIHAGMIRLDDNPRQGTDQTFAARGGATFALGALSAPVAVEGEIMETDPLYPEGTVPWIITGERMKCLLVAPPHFNSEEIAGMVRKAMHGEFTVEMVSAGTLTAGDPLTVPGWRLAKEAYAPKAGLALN